jgi:CheY-like chemotaxis protein
MRQVRVLVIDDDEPITALVKKVLEATGRFRVRAETRSPDAMKSIRAFQPDIILLDLLMPDPDGRTIASALQSQPVFASVPVIFLTGAIQRGGPADGNRTASGRRLIAKPVDPDRLISTIDGELDRGASPHAAAPESGGRA